MKLKLLIGTLIVSATSFAQNITFTDITFKNKLLSASVFNDVASDFNSSHIKIDTNSDGEIQVNEALAVYELYLDFSEINNLVGIEHFTNLRFLSANYNNLEQVNLSALVNVTNVQLSQNMLTSFDAHDLSLLESLILDYNNLTTLNVAGLSNLEMLWLRNNELTTLNIAGPSYKNITFENNFITTFDVASLPNLEVISCGGNPLTGLDFAAMPNLVSFMCEQCQLQNVDLSNSPGIIVLMVTQSSTVQTINLKNGNVAEIMDEWQIFGLPNLDYMCVDNDTEAAWFNMIFQNLPADQRPMISSYCTATPGGAFDTLTGIIQYDATGNGCGPGNAWMPFAKLLVSDGVNTGSIFTDSAGRYTLYLQAGDYNITPVFENNYFSATPATHNHIVPGVSNATMSQNFCAIANGTHNDVSVVIVPTTNARPGFDASYTLLITNNGNLPASGLVTLTFDDDVLDLASANFVPTLSPNTLSYSYPYLAPWQTREKTISFNVNSPMETPPVNIGDVLNFTITITAEADDNMANNTFNMHQTVVGAFDPNDIACLEGEIVHPDKIGQYLHYNINFENTGNAPATFIVVEDIIDTSKFDINTFKVIDSSHPMTVNLSGTKAIFRFDDINLASQGKGNVLFKIKTLPTVAVNSTVTQSANIFFDYNWPIVTNDANTTFTILSRDSHLDTSAVKIYPNPANGIVNIEANKIITTVHLYDVQGRVLISSPQNEMIAALDLSSQPKGIYFLKVITEEGSIVQKIVKE